MKVGLKGAIFLKLSKSIISRMTKDIDLTLYLRMPVTSFTPFYSFWCVTFLSFSYRSTSLQFRICCKAVTGNEPPLTKNALKIHNFKSNYQNSKFKIIITLKKGALRLFPDVLLYLNIIGVETYVYVYTYLHIVAF